MYPSSGRFYKEADGTVIRGESWKEVITRVAEYRRRNNLPPGNPEEEVHGQACQRDPQLCREDNGHQVATPDVRLGTLRGRVLSWLDGKVKEKPAGSLRFVETEEAKRRANICANCPKNTSLSNACATCKQAVATMSEQVTGKRPVADARIGCCLILGEDLKTSAWLDDPALDNPDLPPGCWRKRSL